MMFNSSSSSRSRRIAGKGNEEKVITEAEDPNVADPIVATLKYSDSSGEGDTSSSISNKDDQQ